MDKLYYKVAECVFCILTPDAGKTARLLPSFKDFAISAPIQDSEVHFVLSGGHSIEMPTMPPLAEGNIPGWLGSECKVGEDTYILVKTDADTYRLKAGKDWREIQTSYSVTDPAIRYLLAKTLSMAVGLVLIAEGATTIHASVIEKQGKALLFLGVSGTGKSTHSSLWLKYVEGVSLLNDDEPIIRLLPTGKAVVYGTPWSGKTHCYRNIVADVVALVHLHQHPENKLKRLSIKDAVASLGLSVSMPASDIFLAQKQFDNICNLAERIPLYSLDCRPDREAVALTETLMP